MTGTLSQHSLFLLFDFCFSSLLQKRKPAVADPVDQRKYNVRTETHRKDIDRCVDVPAKPLRKLLEDSDGRVARSHEEHIHILSQNELHKAVQSKGNCTQGNKDAGSVCIIGFAITAAPGETDKQADKHKAHVPHTGVDSQEPVPVQQAGGFCERDRAAQQIVQHHKTIHTALQSPGFQPRDNEAHIQRDTAQLEGKITPGILVVHHDKIVKELLHDFR